MSLRLPLLAAGLLLACTATAADWPEFRGPNRDGVCTETGLLQEWPKAGPPKVWTVKNLGLGFGTPSVAGGKIYGLGTRGGKDGVWALKEADGSEVWFTPFADPRPTNQNNGPSGTPTVRDGKVYALSSLGKLACLDATSGKKLWGVDYVGTYGGRVEKWGYTESPLVDGDKVIGAPGSASATVVAWNKDTGKEVWKTAIRGGAGGGGGYSSPVKATVGGIPMYVVLLGQGGGLVGVHADTGKLLWQYTAAAMGGTAQIPVPVIKGDLVWVSTAYRGGSALLQLVPEGKDRVAVKELKTYRTELMNHHGGMVLVGDHVYFGHAQSSGMPVCVGLKTGEIKWGPEKYPAGAKGSAAVLYADDRLYFRYQNGMMVLIDPSPEGLKVVSSFQLPDPDQRSAPQSWPHPVIANGRLYLRDQNLLHCYDVKADKN
jgi:outer membrane protein assembly factor BamB